MKFSKTLTSAAIGMSIAIGMSGAASAESAKPKNKNEAVVLKAMTELFIKRNTAVLPQIWSDKYKQHNPTILDGRDQLKGMIEALPKNFSYEPGFITSNADIVMIHGRYTNMGPKPLVVVDIFRLKDGKLVEHWDVMQDEVPAPATKSGRPMFDAEGT